MERDAGMFARSTLALCPALATEPAALSSIADFAYNCGLGNLRASTLRKRVNAEDWDGARQELAKWVRGGGKVLKGLVIRRAAEAALLPS
jgi:lysozyme